MKEKYMMGLIEETIVEYIAQKVVEKIVNKQKKAIVIFTGASIGFNQSIKALNSLKDDGWKFDIVMSKGGENALTVDLVKRLLNVDSIITGASEDDLNKIIKENKILIIPTLTIKTASKIANCITDNLTTSIISRFIMAGRPIVASVDGCCPDNEERRFYDFSPKEAYKNKLRENIRTIESYGVGLSKSENLDRKINKALMESLGMATLKKEEKEIVVGSRSVSIESKLITRTTILANTMYDVLNLRADSLVTELAREEAQRQNINLIKYK